MGRFPNIWRASKMLETSRCISIFAQIVATVPFYTRAYFDMGQYSINKSTILGRKWWKSDKKDPNMKIETGVIRFYLGRRTLSEIGQQGALKSTHHGEGAGNMSYKLTMIALSKSILKRLKTSSSRNNKVTRKAVEDTISKSSHWSPDKQTTHCRSSKQRLTPWLCCLFLPLFLTS